MKWLVVHQRRAPRAMMAIMSLLAIQTSIGTQHAAQAVVMPASSAPTAVDSTHVLMRSPGIALRPGASADATSGALEASAVGVAGQRQLVPSAWLETQSDQVYRAIVDKASRDHTLVGANNAQSETVRRILDRLIPFALKWNDRAKSWDWQVSLVRSQTMDAIALPGGKIVIDTGMLDRLQLNDNEIAVLVSHLMAHALREHARAGILQWQHDAMTSSGSSNGNTSGNTKSSGAAARALENDPANIATILNNMHYSESDETESDVIGADIASRAGFDPRAGWVLWRKVDWVAKRRRTPFTLAHPVNAKRLDDLKKRQHDMLPLYAKAIGRTVASLPPYRDAP